MKSTIRSSGFPLERWRWPHERAPDQIRCELERERGRLANLQKNLDACRAASEDATPGGLTEYDPAVLSGFTRKPNRKATERRFAAYDREAAATRQVTDQQEKVAALERRLARALKDAEATCELDKLEKGWVVRDRWGWHRVIRVSKKSVSVETPYTWTDRITLDKIIETRPPADKSGSGGTP